MGFVRYAPLVALGLSVLCLAVGCSRKPKGLLPPDRFEQIMADLLELKSCFVAQDSGELQKKFDRDSMELYAPYFKREGVEREDFEVSLRYYIAQGETFKGMVDQVVSILNMRLERLRDSLNRQADTLHALQDTGLRVRFLLDSSRRPTEEF